MPAAAASRSSGLAPVPTTTMSAAIVSPLLVVIAMRPSGAACRARQRGREPEIDAAPAVLRVDPRAGLLVAHAGEDARHHLDHGGAHAELRRRRRDLEPDQPAADHHQMLRLAQLRRERARLGLGAQIVHPRHAERQRRDLAHHRAGREDERVVGQAPAVGGHDRAPGAVDRVDGRVQHQVHAVTGEALRAGDRRVMRRRLAEQHGLRQRRLLVGLARLVGQQRDVGGRVLLLGADRREHAGRAAADHHDVARVAHRTPAACILVAPRRI